MSEREDMLAELQAFRTNMNRAQVFTLAVTRQFATRIANALAVLDAVEVSDGHAAWEAVVAAKHALRGEA